MSRSKLLSQFILLTKEKMFINDIYIYIYMKYYCVMKRIIFDFSHSLLFVPTFSYKKKNAKYVFFSIFDYNNLYKNSG